MTDAREGWTDRGATDLARRLAGGEVSAVEVVRAHLARIAELDGRLNSFIATNPEAEREAEAADARRARGELPLLNGVPVAIKDNLLATGMPTTCGSRVLGSFRSTRDATVVTRLRAAGAVILGKTNLDEFGMGSSTESSAFGPTRNPWDTERVPGGSSGGSAVAVAAGLAPLALGSDTGGSIRQPAAFCGVVGLKPTYGRVSRSGLVAFGSSLDQVGPIARSVADAALLLAAIAGADPDDSTTATTPVADYVAATDGGVEGLRVGLPREFLDPGLDPEISRALAETADELAKRGARIEEISLPATRYAVPAYYLAATAEASSNLSRYDGVRYGLRLGDESDLVSMYRRTRDAGFGAEVKRRIMLGTFALSAGYHDRFYGTAQSARMRIREELLAAFDSGTELLLTPTTPTTAFRLGSKLDDPLEMYLSDVYTVTANLAGLPALSVPVGASRSGLPIGGQLIGPPFAEGRLLAAGAVLEQRFKVRAPPPAGGAESTVD